MQVLRSSESILFPGEIVPVPMTKSRFLKDPQNTKLLVWYSVISFGSGSGVILRPIARSGSFALCRVEVRFECVGDPGSEEAELLLVDDSCCPSPDAFFRRALPRSVFSPKFNACLLMDEAVRLFNTKATLMESFKPITHRQRPSLELYTIMSRLPLTHSGRCKMMFRTDEVKDKDKDPNTAFLRHSFELMWALLEYLRAADWGNEAIICSTCSRPLVPLQKVYVLPGMESCVNAFMQPNGGGCTLLTTRECESGGNWFTFDEQPDPSFSWFPGYGWRAVFCKRCNHQLGFDFTLLTGGPDDYPGVQLPARFMGFLASAVVSVPRDGMIDAVMGDTMPPLPNIRGS